MARRVRVRGSRRQVWNGTRQKTNGGNDRSVFIRTPLYPPPSPRA